MKLVWGSTAWLGRCAIFSKLLVIKGEVTGTESLYIDGRIEGAVNFAGHRVTIGGNGSVAANISAREVVIIGEVQGNIQCTDRLDMPAHVLLWFLLNLLTER